MTDRVEARRAVDDRGQEGGFGERQLIQRLAEIIHGRRRNAV